MDLQEIDVVNQRELMEAVNLDEESTQRVLYGARFEQYCTVSGLT